DPVVVHAKLGHASILPEPAVARRVATPQWRNGLVCDRATRSGGDVRGRPERVGPGRRACSQAGRARPRTGAGTPPRPRPMASPSCAAVTNHPSNPDGGSETPASSIAWKNGG